MAENSSGGEGLILQGQTNDIAIYRPPETILAEAHKAAVALQDVISKKKDPVMMNGQQYGAIAYLRFGAPEGEVQCQKN